MFTIPENINANMWDANPHLIFLKPFSILYNEDKSKTKETSSKVLRCITWLCHPDEEENRYYRLPENEKLEVCTDFCPTFNLNNSDIQECIDKYPSLCLTLIEQSYKEEKDQLHKISKFLNQQELTLENAEQIIKLKAAMPKIYADFAKTDKEFQRSKSQQRVHGGRQKTIRERGLLQPDE